MSSPSDRSSLKKKNHENLLSLGRVQLPPEAVFRRDRYPSGIC